MARIFNSNNDFKQVYDNTYHSIGGVHIKATMAGVTFGNLQAISYSITREKAPVYTMGSPSPRGFARGKRGIAGSMVFIMFDAHALLDGMRALASTNNARKFVADKDESRPDLKTLDSKTTLAGGAKKGSVVGNISTAGKATNAEEAFVGQLDAGWERTVPWYSDQVPAFNVVLTGVNEGGYASVMSILGVEILNEGYGISIDDIVSEQQMTFVAREVSPWQRSVKNNFNAGVGGNWLVPTDTAQATNQQTP